MKKIKVNRVDLLYMTVRRHVTMDEIIIGALREANTAHGHAMVSQELI